jgi:hypothetical protein
MKRDRFLIGILVFIGVLVITALILFFTRQQKTDYVSEDTPEGVVHNYILAVLNEDYPRAYGYLADGNAKPDFETFQKAFFTNELYVSSYSAQLGRININGDQAFVKLTIIYHSEDPFSGLGSGNVETALLKKQDGEWKILLMPYPYWDWDWRKSPEE